MVQHAFDHEPFTPATPSIQPAHNHTLINLPTYFTATYPQTRINGRPTTGPGTPITITLLGHRIVITPAATSYLYDFGDHHTTGPTHDPGGPYPTGRITHTYVHAGTPTTRIDTTYTGTYTIDGGPAIPLHGSITINGTPQTLTVLSATNHLYANDNP